jgi:DNA-binding GntR family transcriptional regulator
MTLRDGGGFAGETNGGAVQARTLALEVFERLRGDILSGKLAPGTKLRFEDLRASYGVGLSPLREALSRLAENRLVVSIGQRGFRVPPVSVQEIADIAMVRKEIEGLALRLAIQHGNDGWEAAVVAARHKLTVLERHNRDVSEDLWESRHRDFHRTLVSACNSACLIHLHALLCDQFDRYRRLSARSRLPNSPRPLVHQRITEAALARDADLAIALLHDHIDQATALIVAGLQPAAPAKARKTPRLKQDVMS